MLIVSNIDLHWAAGFIEADGTISNSHSKSIQIAADQKTKFPLERLVRAFGGKVYSYKKGKDTYYRWYLYGDKAASVMVNLYNLFSPRRQKSIDACLERQRNKKPRSWHNIVKTHCKHGHPFDEENTIQKSNGGRDCRICQKNANRKYYLRNKVMKGDN